MPGKLAILLKGCTILFLGISFYARAENVEGLVVSTHSDSDITSTSTNSFLTDGTLKFSTGFDYSSGMYGNIEETEIWYVPVSMSYQLKQWKTSVSIPWVQITGPGGITAEGEIINLETKTGSVSTESGLGDIVGSLTYSFDSFGSNLPLVDVTAKIKFPIADENKGLGTGEFDYTIQGDIFKPLGNLTLLGTLGYKFKGDPPGSDLNDVIKASAGMNYKFNDQYSSGILLDFQEATSRNSEDTIDLFAYLTWKINRSISLTGYGATGFTDGAPAKEIGLQVGYKL